MPFFGLGTFQSSGDEGKLAIRHAIDVGYRMFDTAYFYENETAVGVAIKEKITEKVISRKDVCIVSKLWCNFHEPELVEHACRLTLKNFGLDYIDQYLMHWPHAYKYVGDDVMFPLDDNGDVIMNEIDYIDTWRAMERLVELGLTKSIGVSNFNEAQLERLLSVAKIKPVCNQIECHPGLIQKKLISFCRDNNIVVTGYSPLGRPDPTNNLTNYVSDSQIVEIAKKHNKSPGQIILRYLVENDVVPIPKSSNMKRIEENINIFDFKLDDLDHKILQTFNTGHRIFPMLHAAKSKYYPFEIDPSLPYCRAKEFEVLLSK